MLVKVDNLYFSTDFIMLDLDEDREVTLIVGRLFLTTGKTLIDVQQKKLTLLVQGDEVTFNVFETMKYPTDNDEAIKLTLWTS